MKKSFKIIAEQTLYEGFLRVRRCRLRHQRYDGSETPELLRERVEARHAVSVLLYDPSRDRLVLTEQFRIGAVGHVESPWLLETVGGYCEPGEALEAVARRETLEETGCQLQRLEYIGRFFSTPGWSGERISLYCGIVDSEGAGGIHGLAEEGEDIKVVVMDYQDAFGQLFRQANSTSIIIGLQWLALNRQRLRS